MLKILRNLTVKQVALLVISIIFIVLQVWLDLKLPDYMADITRLVETPGSELSEIISAGVKMLVCAGGSLCSAVIVAVLAARAGTGFAAVLREKIFSKVQDFSLAEIGQFSTPSLITRSTNDVMQVQFLIIMGLQAIVKAPIMAVWAVIKIYDKGFDWMVATGVSVVVLVVIVSIGIAIVTPKFRRMQVLTDDLNRVTRENLTGIAVVRAYNAEDYQENKFDAANNILTKTNLFAYRTLATLMPSIQLIMNGLTLAIYWIGTYLIANAALSGKLTLFSNMVVLSSYAIMVIMSFMLLLIVFMLYPRAQVSASRILEVLNTPVSIKDGPETALARLDKTGKTTQGEVEFKNVSFAYPDAASPVLKDISFKATKGQTVAFIGATGCGKSTLINLIPRFYDATAGEVLVDGVDVKDYKLSTLRDKIGYVSQKAVLFSGSVSSNISYGDMGESLEEQDILDAVDTAQSADFVRELDGGIGATVAQGGTNFSGGQKQRLSIARAIARNPEILIFDDSFSALDYKTDRALRDALNKHCKKSTRLIVAQRIGTIMDADLIIVLHDGKMVGKGTHKELLKTCDEYKQIALSQLSEQELVA